MANQTHSGGTQSRRRRAPSQPPTRTGKENVQPAAVSRQQRERRPTAKVTEQREAAAEAARREAEAEARRAARAQKAQRRQEYQAGIDTRNDGELEERPDTMFTSTLVSSRPSILVERTTRVPLAAPAGPKPASRQLAPISEDSEDDIPEDRGRSLSRGSQQSCRSRHHIVSPSQDSRSRSQGPPSGNVHSPSPPPSRSVSPQAGQRRPREEDNEDFDLVVGLMKAQKINSSSSRPKAADYDDTAREVILLAASRYRGLISAYNAFPDSSTEIRFVKEAWKFANETSGLPAIAISPDIAKIIKARGSQLRGEVKSKLVAHVEAMYGFDSGRSRRMVVQNRKLAEELKEQHGYMYREIKDNIRKGIYNHAIIQKAINNIWFKNKRDEGVVFSDLFNPLPISAVALILTAIECCVDEWVTGTKTDVIFWADDYRAVYMTHIKTLESFGQHTKDHDLLGRMQRKLHNYGRLHAGAPPVILENAFSVPVAAFRDAVKDYEEDPNTDDEGDNMLP